ncbi:MAG: hypothetical protein JO043_08830 [Candidatus Eremiobacteraeota bacterium]|nr:hypothetical protein [Candidatus Eremiobacteraeota bacterium]
MSYVPRWLSRLSVTAASVIALVTSALVATEAAVSQRTGLETGSRNRGPSRYVIRNDRIGPIVRPKMPGQILGYDIDQHGTDGILANYRDLGNGKTESSLEMFDEITGKITKVVSQGTKNGYVADGILSRDIGFLTSNNGFALMNPVTGGKINGTWTAPMTFYLGQIAENQATPNQVMFGYDGSQPSQPTTLVTADVPNKTTKVIGLDQNLFGTGDVPVIAQDWKTNQAVIAGSNGSPLSHAAFGIIDLATGKTTTFTGLGFGYVNGLDVDSKRGIACATTEIDAGVEFYDLKKQTGFEVTIPNSGGQQIHSGSSVAMDSEHGLCVVTQPVSGNGTQASAIWIVDEKGNFREEIQGFNFWFGVGPVLNPTKRIGYVLNPRPSYMTLTGFSY